MDTTSKLALLCGKIETVLNSSKVKIKNSIMENVKQILSEIMLLGCAPPANNDDNNIIVINIKHALNRRKCHHSKKNSKQ